MLNTEKLDYNFQVLKKREDENLMVRNAQKRRLTKLNETIFILRRTIKNVQMNCLIETEKLTSDILKLRFNINHLNSKASTFSEVNDKKYHSVWQMNRNECLDVLKGIFEIDQVLVEQHLGLKWQVPCLPGDEIHTLLDKINLMDGGSINRQADIKKLFQTFEDLNDRKLMLDVIQTVLKQAGFLVDKTALQLIEQNADNEQKLLCLDNVFGALGIANWEDLKKLKAKFLDILEKRSKDTNDFFSKSDGSLNDQCEDNLKDATNDNVSDSQKIPILVPSKNLSTFKQFAQQLAIETTIPLPITEGLSRKILAKEVREYWFNIKNIFSPDRVKMWNTMEANIFKYLEILKERKKLDEECDFLRKQNMELQHLMQKNDETKI